MLRSTGFARAMRLRALVAPTTDAGAVRGAPPDAGVVGAFARTGAGRANSPLLPRSSRAWAA
ncbi:hypothetical protein ACPESV_34100 [Streptomyces umbrinus]|uniref:hypothetical protein n=1 Tax=Streptomyces umbrinus TaxID=67370 RepID=UPI003C2D1E91